jgi:hypothetical protein
MSLPANLLAASLAGLDLQNELAKILSLQPISD